MRSSSNPVQTIRNDYTGTSITTSAYVQLTAATTSEVNSAEINDTSGQDLILALGAAGAEVDTYRIPKNKAGIIPIHISVGTRISAKAVSASATTGTLIINLFY